jgi:excisionase family DNA binding protein
MCRCGVSNVSLIAFDSSAAYADTMTSLLELPTPEIADEAQRALRGFTRGRARVDAHVRLIAAGGDGEQVTVPRAAFELFLEVLGQMANGNAVTIVPVHAELTTQQAADLLNVSRPHLVSLLESGKLPFRKVGTHRRVLYADLSSYQRARDEASRAALAELSRQAQELDLDY